MCVCIARQVTDGDILVQGLATPIVAAGYLLAKHSHAPNVVFASAIGQTICREGTRLGLSHAEELWLNKSMSAFGFVHGVADLMPSVKPKEFFRPAQVDAKGNFNNIVIGKDYRKPRMRLPGVGGIPDVTNYLPDVYLYVPRHSRVTFTEKVDFISGRGHDPRRRHGAGAKYLVSDLGEFDFKHGRLRLKSVHPGVDVERIYKKTGFELDQCEPLETTMPPSTEELDLVRNIIDPDGIRRIEFSTGVDRRRLLAEILKAESGRKGREKADLVDEPRGGYTS
jgi:hypothetical protein